MKNEGDMISYKSWLNAGVVTCLTCFLLITSCGTSENTEEESPEIDSTAASENAWQETQVFYQVPAPDEMISFIKQGGFDFNGSFLNPVDNVNNHVDQKGQALNMGIYTADLTYMASYGQFQQSAKYFNAIMKLSDELGISSAFDEALVGRVKNNLENSDSLELISRDSYYSIVDNLERSQRGKTLALIAAGGWLESVYIVVNLMDEFNPNQDIVQRLADQKLVMENLMLYLGKYKAEPSVASTLEDFKSLSEIYENLEVTGSETSLKEEGDKLVIGGSGKILISKEKFNLLKQEIIRLRDSIASVNS